MNIPLGKATTYPSQYSPELLAPISRETSRAGMEQHLPFVGVDIWNAWELSWLRENGHPEIAAAVIKVPASSPNIVESKSLKLYLNSFSMTRFGSAETVRDRIQRDLSEAAGSPVDVSLMTDKDHRPALIGKLPGLCLDQLNVECSDKAPNADLLKCIIGGSIREELHTHLFRSLCPVTAQPDLASIYINYTGRRIDEESLLRYIVSFREHQDFHEACVERIFVDILTACEPEKLCVYARFERRGGIDINPWRANYDALMPNVRLWRQ